MSTRIAPVLLACLMLAACAAKDPNVYRFQSSSLTIREVPQGYVALSRQHAKLFEKMKSLSPELSGLLIESYTSPESIRLFEDKGMFYTYPMIQLCRVQLPAQMTTEQIKTFKDKMRNEYRASFKSKTKEMSNRIDAVIESEYGVKLKDTTLNLEFSDNVREDGRHIAFTSIMNSSSDIMGTKLNAHLWGIQGAFPCKDMILFANIERVSDSAEADTENYNDFLALMNIITRDNCPEMPQ